MHGKPLRGIQFIRSGRFFHETGAIKDKKKVIKKKMMDQGVAANIFAVPVYVACVLFLSTMAMLAPVHAQAAVGTITTVAGTGVAGFSGDGGPATAAQISWPWGVSVDSAGNLYIADLGNHRIRKVDAATGVISTVAGTGVVGSSGDGGAATAAQLRNPYGVSIDSAGNLYIADLGNHRIRKVDASGVISTVAGTGVYGFSGDGGAATAAQLANPIAVSVDSAGNLYIADLDNFRIRKVDATTGVINTVAGTGVYGFSGDGGPATAAQLKSPYAVSVDSAGNLYIADIFNQRIRKVDAATGVISTVAGTGVYGSSGDGGVAIAVRLAFPIDVSVDSAGNLYIADNDSNRIRKVDVTTGVISTVAGTSAWGFSGDGGAATAAQLRTPVAISLDGAGNLYIADRSNQRIRKVEGIAASGNQPPVATDDAYNTNEDASLNVAIPGVLSNDTDADTDALTAVSAAGTSNGVLTLNADGSFNYTPNANFNGTDSFTYTANDGTADSAIATVTMTVNAVNDAPVAVPDAAISNEDMLVNIDVLGNDSDVDGDVLSVSAITPAANGTVSNNGANVIYMPNANFNGSDSFTYTVSDGNGGTATATVNITVNPVNDAPMAVNDAYSVPEDVQMVVGAVGPLGNDSDVDGDLLTAVLVSGVSHGTLTLKANGELWYKPNLNFNGVDSLTYVASDGVLNSNIATVTITVTPRNDRPLAFSNIYAASEDTPLVITAAASVLNNDVDVDGDALTAILVSPTSNGTLALNSDGSFSYTPNANFNGNDFFTYKVNDGTIDSRFPASVRITVAAVNDAPVAVPDAATTAEDTAVAVSVLSNDSDIDGDVLTVSAVGIAANGTLSTDGTTVTYTPNLNFNGSDSFTYDISDGNGGAATATVNVTITAVNDAPVANPDAATTAEESPVTVAVLLNDTDVDGDPLTVIAAGPAGNGNVLVNPDGTVIYTPFPNFNGVDAFGYFISDGTTSAVGMITITVTPLNDAPFLTLLGISPVVVEGGSVYSDAGATAFDIEDGNITPSIVVTGSVNTSAIGTYTLTYNVQDSGGLLAMPVSRVVNVVDTTAPVFPLLTPVVVTATGLQTAVVLTSPLATDLFAPVILTNNAPLTFPLGLTTVLWTATDANGNVSTATQTVTVNVPNVALLTPAQIALLTPAQLALLSPAQLAALTPTQIAALTPIQLGALLPSLTPAQIAALMPIQIAALSPIQIASIIGGLTPAQAALLTSVQVGALTAAQIAALSPQVAAVLNPLLGNEEEASDDDEDKDEEASDENDEENDADSKDENDEEGDKDD